MTKTDENVWTVWSDYPNPRSMDRDDLLEALDQLDPVSYNEEERESFSDWYRAIPEDVRDDAALNMPHKVMAAEIIVFRDLKGVYRRVIRRNAEYKHLRREIMGLQRENERLRGVIARKAAWEQMKEETKNVRADFARSRDVDAECDDDNGCAGDVSSATGVSDGGAAEDAGCPF